MATTHLLLALSLLLPLISGQCTIERAEPYFRRSVYEFSIDLMSRIAQETENHFITSALSPWTLISAVSLGAADETLAEIKQVLQLHRHPCFNKRYFDIIKKITAPKDGTTLERSSTIFVDARMPLNEVFRSRIKKTQVSEIESLTFDNLVTVAATINEYVNRSTHGNIDDIVSPTDLEGIYVVLIDALYFKGTWQVPFSAADTEISAFYDEKRNQIGDVNLMFAELEVNVMSIDQIEATVLELPYGREGIDDRFSMLFILPDVDRTIATVLDNLKRITVRSIFTLFNTTGPTVAFVQIPRFKISSDLDNLKELLTDMGLKTMFDISRARFPDMSDYSMYISDFIQKANIEVNEEGSEASASTAGMLSDRSLFVTQFVANKPFLFMIVDKKTEVALFSGAYSKPSIY